MKCLITGINGFVGSYLSEYLLKKNIEVYGTVYPANAIENISHLKHKIKLYSCNIINQKEITNIVKDSNPNIIFHLAGQANVPLSWQDPINTFNINVFGTIYLLNAIKEFSPKAKTLMVGSGDEYGHYRGKHLANENDPLNPQNPYAITKVCSDLLSWQLGDYYKLHVVRVRAFPHVGPRQAPNFVVSDFCRQIALIEKGKQPPIIKTGNIENKRSFTDVRDMVHAYWLAIKKGIPGEVYNISSEKIYTIREILNDLLKLTSQNIKIEPDPAKFRPHDTGIKDGNSKKFRNLTGWKPEISIKKTLEETLNWWRKQI
jgi:GDP-4-dehydro-6-deoxy-D-mannose reductase